MGSLSSTELPALHRVLFMIINNIIIPKRMIKTNVEMSGVFYLRSWLEKDFHINVGAIMFQHMQKVAQSKTDSLPYAHFISAFLMSDAIPSFKPEDTREPRNLFDLLTSYGWVVNDEEQIVPNPGDLKNSYLFQTGAAPNQYVPVGEPLPDAQTERASSSSSCPSNKDIMDFLIKMNERLQSIENDRQEENEKIDERLTNLEAKLTDMDINIHKFWGSMEAKLKDNTGGSDDGEE